MSRERIELKKYKHQELMNELNEMSIKLKIWLYHSDNEQLTNSRPKPTVQELDDLFLNKIMDVLRKDSEPLVKY